MLCHHCRLRSSSHCRWCRLLSSAAATARWRHDCRQRQARFTSQKLIASRHSSSAAAASSLHAHARTSAVRHTPWGRPRSCALTQPKHAAPCGGGGQQPRPPVVLHRHVLHQARAPLHASCCLLLLGVQLAVAAVTVAVVPATARRPAAQQPRPASAGCRSWAGCASGLQQVQLPLQQVCFAGCCCHLRVHGLPQAALLAGQQQPRWQRVLRRPRHAKAAAAAAAAMRWRLEGAHFRLDAARCGAASAVRRGRRKLVHLCVMAAAATAAVAEAAAAVAVAPLAHAGRRGSRPQPC